MSAVFSNRHGAVRQWTARLAIAGANCAALPTIVHASLLWLSNKRRAIRVRVIVHVAVPRTRTSAAYFASGGQRSSAAAFRPLFGLPSFGPTPGQKVYFPLEDAPARRIHTAACRPLENSNERTPRLAHLLLKDSLAHVRAELRRPLRNFPAPGCLPVKPFGCIPEGRRARTSERCTAI